MELGLTWLCYGYSTCATAMKGSWETFTRPEAALASALHYGSVHPVRLEGRDYVS